MADKQKKNRKKGGFLTAAGILLLLGALGLTSYNIWDGLRARHESLAIEEQIAARMPETIVEARDPLAMEETDLSMPVFEIDGYSYVGVIEIPSLKISLPVMDTWDDSRLRIAACRYWGNYKTDDMVICAHNYIQFFAPIRGIGMGADVYFISAGDTAYHYQVTNRETLRPTAVEEMVTNTVQGTDGKEVRDWDLTLFTCFPGGQTRCAVRCVRVMEEDQAQEAGT